MSIQYSDSERNQLAQMRDDITALATTDGKLNASWWHTQSAGDGAKMLPDRAALDDLVWEVAKGYDMLAHNFPAYDLYHETFIQAFRKEWFELNSQAAGVGRIDTGVVRAGVTDTGTFQTKGGRKFTYNQKVK